MSDRQLIVHAKRVRRLIPVQLRDAPARIGNCAVRVSESARECWLRQRLDLVLRDQLAIIPAVPVARSDGESFHGGNLVRPLREQRAALVDAGTDVGAAAEQVGTLVVVVVFLEPEGADDPVEMVLERRAENLELLAPLIAIQRVLGIEQS